MSVASTTIGPSSGLAISFSEASTLPSTTASISGSPAHDSALSIQCSVPYAGMNQENVSTAARDSVDVDECYSPLAQSSACVEGAQAGRQSLLEIHGTPGQTAAELKEILGNAHSRLKSGAEISSGAFLESQRPHNVSLERAKSRSRVNLDIFLHNDVCVQGGSLRGYIQINIKKHLKKQKPVLISRGSIRLIGFEGLDADGERSIFYQCSSFLSDVTLGINRIYSSEPDSEGFSTATEGTHSLPFALYLNPGSETGTPKGILPLQSGLSIRYIAMVSLGIKDSSSCTRSIAHFYRDCSIWPRLNPSIVLAPTSRPIQITASESLRLGGNGQITLTASIHRLHWVSGQSCFVKVKVVNKSEKALKNMCLQLLRSTTVFRTGYEFDALKEGSKTGAIADVLQSSTTKKLVAQSILEVCARGTRGHASAKGWWAGVTPGQTRSFSHQLPIPPDALSISRGHLIEVSYELQVIANVGTILSTEVKVSLPIEIVNFLSLDPPHSTPISNPTGTSIQSSNSSEFPELTSLTDSEYAERYSDTEDDQDSEDERVVQPNGRINHHGSDIVPANLITDESKSPPRFADLYYSSLQENLDKAAAQHEQDTIENRETLTRSQHGNLQNTFAVRVKEKYLQRQSLLASNAPSGDEVNCQELDTGLYTSAVIGEERPPTSNSSLSPDYVCRSDSLRNNQTTCSSNIDSVERATSKTPYAGPTKTGSFPQNAEKSAVSGVGLSNGHIQRLSRKMPEARADRLPEPESSTLLPRIAQASSPSAPRVGTVKDKIRELEEIVAKAESCV